MAINFPNSPSAGNTYEYNSIIWSWNGAAWDRQSTNVVGITGATGATGPQGVTGPVGDYVISFNGLTGAVGITAGNQISLTQNGNIFSIGVIEGSTSGLDADTLRGVSGQRFLENLQTGLLYGGLISVNAGNTAQVDITAGAGIVVYPGASLTVYPIPTVTPVTWTAKTGVTLSGLTSSDETWLAIDSSGSLVQTNVAFTDAQYASQIPLGAALHLSRTYIQLVKTYPHVSYAQPEQFDPFIRAFGNLKLSGHEVTANGANLTVNRSAGKAYALGRNYKNDPNNPNTVTDTSAIPVTTVYHFYRNGSGAFTTTINGQIHPGSLDNGTGTLGTVTPAKYTIQRIFYLPDQPTLLGVYYGRQEYNSISDALANIPFEEFSESESTATQGIFCGWLIVRGNATALNDTADAKFVNAGLFRNTANIGGGGLAIASIDDLNDVTTTTPTNNQVLRWNSGTAQWVNSDVSSLAVSSFNGLTGAVTGVTTSTANTFTALNSFNAGISAAGATFSGVVKASAGVLTDSVVPLVGAGSAGTLYINANASGGGGGSITNIGDWTTDSSGTYIIVDDGAEAVTISAAASIDLNSVVNILGTAYFGSTVTVISGGAVLQWDGFGVAPIVFTVANTNTSANNILFNAAGGATFAADIAVNGVRVGRGSGSVATNTVLGAGAGAAGTTGANNTFVGSGAGDAVTTGSRNIAIGSNALGAGVTTDYCVAVGYNALLLNRGNSNIAIGDSALDASTTGFNNVAIGVDALTTLTTGSYNMAVGGSLRAVTTGANNVGVGQSSMINVTTGSSNIAIGTFALYQANTSSSSNTAIGNQAGGGGAASATVQSNNTFIGASSARSITTGSQNVGIGMESIYGITGSSNNTALGYQAGRYTANGTTELTVTANSLYLGYGVRGSTNSVTNETAIGYQAIGLGSNTTAIGNSSTLGNRIFGVASTGQVAPTIASAATIAPTTSVVFISGTAAVATITAPSLIATTGGQITLIPTGLFTTTAAGNIALASTAVVSKALIMTYDATTTKWYPSY